MLRLTLFRSLPVTVAREVIVERAAEARENDQEAKLKKKQQDRAKSMEDTGRETP